MSRILTQIIATRVPHDALPPLHCLAGRGQVAAGHGGGVLGLAHLGLLGPKVAAEEGRTAEGGAEAAAVHAGGAARRALNKGFIEGFIYTHNFRNECLFSVYCTVFIKSTRHH